MVIRGRVHWTKIPRPKHLAAASCPHFWKILKLWACKNYAYTWETVYCKQVHNMYYQIRAVHVFISLYSGDGMDGAPGNNEAREFLWCRLHFLWTLLITWWCWVFEQPHLQNYDPNLLSHHHSHDTHFLSGFYFDNGHSVQMIEYCDWLLFSDG